MDWKKKTVSMGLTKEESVDLHLGTVIISTRRVRVEPNDVEDWKHIFAELGTDIVLEEVYWDDVEDMDITVKDLYYPHINIWVNTTDQDEPQRMDLDERRIFFREDELDELKHCFRLIRTFWQQWQQNTVVDDDRFADELDDDAPDEEVELEEALQIEAARRTDTKDESVEQDTTGSETGQTMVSDGAVRGNDEDPSADDDKEKVEQAEDASEEEADDDSDNEEHELDEIVDRFMDQ